MEAGIGGGYQAMHDRGELSADADPGQLATATLAALQGGMLLTQVRAHTQPLEAALDTVRPRRIAHDRLTRGGAVRGRRAHRGVAAAGGVAGGRRVGQVAVAGARTGFVRPNYWPRVGRAR